jgi:hypothetical protein
VQTHMQTISEWLSGTLRHKTVVLAGCGGGYDVFGALPLYFKLRELGARVILVNLSFVDRQSADAAVAGGLGTRLGEYLYRFTGYRDGVDGLSARFFPEGRLAAELQQPVHAILCHEDPSIQDIVDSYTTLLSLPPETADSPESPETADTPESAPAVDALLLVDGGCDALMTGAETHLATPVEDMSHMCAVQRLPSSLVAAKYLVVVGADVDCAHSIVEAELSARLQALESHLVCQPWQLEPTDNACQAYERVFMQCQPINSIVQSLILAAMHGERGLYTPQHLASRIEHNLVPLNSRLCTMLLYPLQQIHNDLLYKHHLEPHMRPDQIDDVIGHFHHDLLHGSHTPESRTAADSALPVAV